MTATMGPAPPKTPTAAADASTSQSSNTTAMGPPTPRIPTAATESSTSEPSYTTAMGPPPPRNPTSADKPSTSKSSTTAVTSSSPPRNPNPSAPESSRTLEESGPPQMDVGQPPSEDTDSSAPNFSNDHHELSHPQTDASETIVVKKQEKCNDSTAVVPYTKPDWSGAPCHRFSLEVLKQGAIIDKIDVNKKGAYMFGRVDLCDFVLEHPTISRFHAVLQFKSTGDAFLYDLGSTHGTFVNKKEVNKRVYVDLHVGDVVRFGQSSRLYIFQGPSDLMPMEGDLKSIRNAKLRQEMKDMEASLRRAKIEASHADGISWGMGEDAVEENEDEVDEITWQNYKGQLTEKQEKTREKVIKRLEKIGHMRKEIDAIRAKDVAQGGLTQGQQTQIARNEQRMSQIMEELENLEETLNESIRESLGARGGWSSRGKKKGPMGDDEEDYISDDDEFYDRTIKSSKTQKSAKHKNGENPSVETADTLLDKKDTLIKEMEEKKKLIMDEEGKKVETNEVAEAGDALDAYMSAVSTQLVLDTKEKLQKELSTLQLELDRILYLLKIVDPTGEAAKKRESERLKPKETVNTNPAPDSHNRPSAEKILKFTPIVEKNKKVAPSVEKTENPVPEVSSKAADVATSQPGSDSATDRADGAAATACTVTKFQWLGAVEEKRRQETVQEATVEMQDADQFVDYKDREKILQAQMDVGIEEAAPGLIIRKRKQVDQSKVNEVKDSEGSSGSEFKAEDAVALLLRHSKGYHVPDEEETYKGEEAVVKKKKKTERTDAKKAKRALGPERPSFLDEEPDLTTWVPPEGQSGDGRTSLNDRLGY